MFGKMDPKKKALEELMSHLDSRDGEELGEVVKPKGVGIEMTKVEKMGEPDGDEVPGMGSDEGDKASMSEEEIQELIEALQSKLSC